MAGEQGYRLNRSVFKGREVKYAGACAMHFVVRVCVRVCPPSFFIAGQNWRCDQRSTRGMAANCLSSRTSQNCGFSKMLGLLLSGKRVQKPLLSFHFSIFVPFKSGDDTRESLENPHYTFHHIVQ